MAMGGKFSDMAAFKAKFQADMKRLQKGVDSGLRRAMSNAVEEVRKNAPEASGFLKESIHASGLKIVCDAPYAIYVERGSRPHWPPIAPILAWVLQKGFVGYSASGKPQSAESIAHAIAYKISVEGTKPTWFMRNSIPATMRWIGYEIKGALRRL